MAGAESLHALREGHPATSVAVFTGSDDRATILQCLGAGVHGYILKSLPVEEIQRAIATILSGGVYVAPSLAQVDPAQEAPSLEPARETPATEPPPGDARRFTNRQLDVLRLLAEGRSTKEIARTLDPGPGTVKIHLAAIFQTLNAHNRTEAVVLASKLKL